MLHPAWIKVDVITGTVGFIAYSPGKHRRNMFPASARTTFKSGGAFYVTFFAEKNDKTTAAALYL